MTDGSLSTVPVDEGISPRGVALSGDGHTLLFAGELQGLGIEERDVPFWPIEIFAVDLGGAGDVRAEQLTSLADSEPYPDSNLSSNGLSGDGAVAVVTQYSWFDGDASNPIRRVPLVIDADGTPTVVEQDLIDGLGMETSVISADGRRLAFTGPDEAIGVWDISDGRLVASLPDQVVASGDLGISGDGTVVSFIGRPAGAWPEEDQLWLWEVDEDSVEEATQNTEGYMAGAVISADGDHVAYSGNNDEHDVYVWSRNQPTVQVTQDTGTDYSYAQDISSDGSRVLFISDSDSLVDGDTNEMSDLFMWDRSTGHMTRIGEGGENLQSASMSEDGCLVAFLTGESESLPAEYQNRDEPQVFFGTINVWTAQTE